VPRAEELNNSISKPVKARLHRKQYRTDRILPQVSRADLVVGQQEFCSIMTIFNYSLIAALFKEKLKLP